MKLTKERIEKLAGKIMGELLKRELYEGVIIYYNNKRLRTKNGELIVEDGYDPHKYFEYAAYNHILSMSFDGFLYREINYGKGAPWLNKLLEKYGLYYELGDAWNMSVFPISDGNDIEYTYYEEPKPTLYISHSNRRYCDDALNATLDMWFNTARRCGANGSCVIGDGFEFEYKGDKYFMSTNYNQSDSTEETLRVVEAKLRLIGATNIKYNCGRLD